MERPVLNLPLGTSTGVFQRLERDKPIQARKDASLSAFAGLRSTRRRDGQGWQGGVQITHKDWEQGQALKTPIGKIFGAGEAQGFSEIYQILLLPQGNAKPVGPTYELSPNRTTRVMTPFAAFLHGRFDQMGRIAGVVNLYPYGGRDDWSFLGTPDVTDYWNYGWVSESDIASMDSTALFFDQDLRKHLELALTHWMQWDTLPEKILDGKKIFDDIAPKSVREDEIDMSEFR